MRQFSNDVYDEIAAVLEEEADRIEGQRGPEVVGADGILVASNAPST